MAVNLFDLLQMLGPGTTVPTEGGLYNTLPAQLPSTGQTPPIMAGPLPNEVVDNTNSITVQGNKAQPPSIEDDPAPIPMNNVSYIEEARDALSKAPQHKGMFRTKGTLRNILGTLGDAFLVQSGNKPVYAPQRQLERQQDALSGFTVNPIAAIERMAQVDPKAAQDLYDTYQGNLLRQAQLESLATSRESMTAKRSQDMREIGLNRLSRWVRGNLPYNQILAGAKMYGISPDDLASLGVSPDMTPEQRAQFASGDLSVNQQMQIPLRERQLDIAQQNASANTLRASRAPQPRQEPNPTAASIAAPILQKVQKGQALSAGESELLRRLGFPEDRGRTRSAGRRTGGSLQNPVEGARRRNNRTGEIQTFRNGQWQ